MCVTETPHKPSKAKRTTKPEAVTDLLKRFQHPKGDLVHIYLNETSSPSFTISKTLLCRTSPYFQRSLHYTNTLQLQPIDPIVFGIFLFWLTKNHVPKDHELTSTSTSSELQDSIPGNETDNGQVLLIRTWNFAEMIEIPALQNDVMRALFDTLNTDDHAHFTPKVLEECLRLSHKGSMLRRALITYMFWYDDLSMMMNHFVAEQNVILQDEVNVDGIEGLEEDLVQCAKLWEVVDGDVGRPRPEMFSVPVVGKMMVASELEDGEEENVEVLEGGEAEYLMD